MRYPCAQVAQSVEQRIENPRVGSSILSLGTIFPFTSVRICLSEVRAIEVPIKDDTDRENLRDVMKRHGDKYGLHFVDTSASWQAAPPEFRKTLYFALDRPTKQREEWEVTAKDDGKGADPWVVFFYGVDPLAAKVSRDQLVSVLRERFPNLLEVPITPSGALPLRHDLIRTPAGYEVRSDRRSLWSAPGTQGHANSTSKR